MEKACGRVDVPLSLTRRCDDGSAFGSWRGHMNRVLFATTAIFGAVLIAAPALADEAPAAAKPVRHRQIERAPAREAPERTAAAQPNWTGSQVGGQGGVNSMAQGFAEPGSRLSPFCLPVGSY